MENLKFYNAEEAREALGLDDEVWTVDRILAETTLRRVLAQSIEVLAAWVIQQEKELYSQVILAHEPYVWNDVLQIYLYPEIARKYPKDKDVPLLMKGGYGDSYIESLIGRSMWYAGDQAQYAMFMSSANDTELKWRNEYTRLHRIGSKPEIEFSNA